MKFTMNGLVANTLDLQIMFKDALVGDDASLKYFADDIRSAVIESIIARGPDYFYFISPIAEHLGIHMNDNLVYSIFDVIVDGLCDGVYAWENIRVTFEDNEYIECYFDIEVDIDGILAELG